MYHFQQTMFNLFSFPYIFFWLLVERTIISFLDIFVPPVERRYLLCELCRGKILFLPYNGCSSNLFSYPLLSLHSFFQFCKVVIFKLIIKKTCLNVFLVYVRFHRINQQPILVCCINHSIYVLISGSY